VTGETSPGVIVAGVSHRTAPIEVREKLVFRSAEAATALSALTGRGAIQEGVILSTCNRTELYAVESTAGCVPAIWEMLSVRLGTDAMEHGYVRRGREAVAHLFRVASGLDSMIIGEAQIHGQVKESLEHCRAHAGPVLNRLFQTALLTGSRTRTETGIGRGAASVSSAAVQLAKKIFGSLHGRRAMILGAGDVAELALECFRTEGVRVSIVANRSFERARDLAERHGAVAVHYDEFWSSITDVDVLLCSTAAPVQVVKVEHIAAATDVRSGRPLCILDIALPRDVDPAVGDLDNVFLYDLDDLRAAAAANLDKRAEDIPAAEKIVEAEAQKYWDWLAGLAAVPVVKLVRGEMERIRRQEVAAALRKLGTLTPEQMESVEHLSRALMNKFLHEPSVRLRAAAANGRGLGVVDAARYLFALEQPAGEPSQEGVVEEDAEKRA